MPKPSILPLIALLWLPITIIPWPAHACGWWGDGEMGRHSGTNSSVPGGRAASEKLDIESAKLPGREGYGIAVTGPGLAVPYLQATYGRKPDRIAELAAFGFAAVIDLGTPIKTARIHEAETMAAGMSYMSIPVKGDTPDTGQSRLFNRMIAGSGGAPLLVYAPAAPLLAFFWASHRIALGAPLAFAIQQGKSLGLTPVQEVELRKRVSAGKL